MKQVRRSGVGWHWDGSPKVIHPDGRRSCRWCKGPVARDRRGNFCSSACLHQWLIRSDRKYVRSIVSARDHGVCQRCGADADRMLREVQETIRRQLGGDYHWRSPQAGRVRKMALRALGVPLIRNELWDPVYREPPTDAGYDLDNLTTACLRCLPNLPSWAALKSVRTD